jgi:hypothetical protein
MKENAVHTINQHVHLRSQLLRQMEKDLQMDPMDIDTQAPDFFQQLEQALTVHLSPIITGQPHQLMQYLYKVDVGEKALDEALHSGQYPNLTAALVHLIIRREATKIYFRWLFAGGLPGSS